MTVTDLKLRAEIRQAAHDREGKAVSMTPEMSLMCGGADDFLRAFREVWEMPYVVIPQGKRN